MGLTISGLTKGLLKLNGILKDWVETTVVKNRSELQKSKIWQNAKFWSETSFASKLYFWPRLYRTPGELMRILQILTNFDLNANFCPKFGVLTRAFTVQNWGLKKLADHNYRNLRFVNALDLTNTSTFDQNINSWQKFIFLTSALARHQISDKKMAR